MSYRVDDGYVTINTAASGVGATYSVRAQNATGTTSTGGNLTLESGSGTSTAGNVIVKTGGITRLTISPASTTFADTATALTIAPVSSGTTTLTFANTVTAATITQSASTTGTGTRLSVIAQSTSNPGSTGGIANIRSGSATGASGTGGSLFLDSGGGVTGNGAISFRTDTNPTGGTAFTTFLTFLNSAGLGPEPSGSVDMNWVSTITAPRIVHATSAVNGATGADFVIRAQNMGGTTTTGGNVKLQSGTGTTIDGYTTILTGNTENTRFIPNKMVHLSGQRQKLTSVSTTPYAVLASDFNIMVDTSTLAITVNLPATPTTGDAYRIKDSTGTASTHNITVAGNGSNIEGTSTKTINVNFDKLSVLYNGTQWVLI